MSKRAVYHFSHVLEDGVSGKIWLLVERSESWKFFLGITTCMKMRFLRNWLSKRQTGRVWAKSLVAFNNSTVFYLLQLLWLPFMLDPYAAGGLLWPIQKWCKKTWIMTENPGQMGNSSESTQRELSNEYQHGQGFKCFFKKYLDESSFQHWKGLKAEYFALN